MSPACGCDPYIPARTCSGVRPSVPSALSLPSAISSDSSAQVIGSSRTPVGGREGGAHGLQVRGTLMPRSSASQ